MKAKLKVSLPRTSVSATEKAKSAPITTETIMPPVAVRSVLRIAAKVAGSLSTPMERPETSPAKPAFARLMSGSRQSRNRQAKTKGTSQRGSAAGVAPTLACGTPCVRL
ncbi:hypothetical protein D9M68_404250 [compost metagenome]